MTSLSHNAAVVFLTRVGKAIVSFLGLVFFIRTLGEAEFGSFVLFQTLLGLLYLIADLGIDNAIEKKVSERYNSYVLGTALLVKLASAVVISTAIIAFEGPLSSFFDAEIALLLIPGIFVRQIGGAFLHTLRGELRVQEASLLQFVKHLLFVATGVGLIEAGFGVVGLVVSFVSSWFVLCAVAVHRLEYPIQVGGYRTLKSLFDFSKYGFISSSLVGSAYSWIDTLAIGVFLTQSHVTAYEAAWRTTRLVMLLSGSLSTSLFPQISQWDATSARETIADSIPNSLVISFSLVIPSIVGSYLLGAEILGVLFDIEGSAAALALVVLMAGSLAEAFNNVFAHVLLGINRPKLTARAAVVFLALNIGLNLLLVPPFELVGAATSTAIAFAIYTVVNWRYTNELIEFSFPSRSLLSSFLSSVFMGLILMLLLFHWTVTTVSSLFLVVLLGCLLYSLPMFYDRRTNLVQRRMYRRTMDRDT